MGEDQIADWRLSATAHATVVDQPVDWRPVPGYGTLPFSGQNIIPLYTTWTGMEALVRHLGRAGFRVALLMHSATDFRATLEDGYGAHYGRAADAPRALIAAAFKAFNVPAET